LAPVVLRIVSICSGILIVLINFGTLKINSKHLTFWKGSAITNRREFGSCLGRVFNCKLSSFTDDTKNAAPCKWPFISLWFSMMISLWFSLMPSLWFLWCYLYGLVWCYLYGLVLSYLYGLVLWYLYGLVSYILVLWYLYGLVWCYLYGLI
jgi:hypothetical protein